MAGGVELSPLNGAYQNQKFWEYVAADNYDFTTAAGTIGNSFLVKNDFAEILGAGIGYAANSGAVTTPGGFNIEYQVPGGSRVALVAGFVGPRITANLLLAPNDIYVNYDQATRKQPVGLLNGAAFPQLVRGTRVWMVGVAGVGGTQSGRPYIVYRARPVARP